MLLKTIAAQTKRITGQAGNALRTAALALPVAVACHPAFAQTSSSLPTVTPPTTGLGGGSVTQGDLMSEFGGWLRLGLMLACIAVAVIAVLWAGLGIFRRWGMYAEGREELGQFVTFTLMGGVFAALMVALATTAITYLG